MPFSVYSHFGVFALLHLYPTLLRALHYRALFISTLCIGIELEALHFAERIAGGRDAHLCQRVGEGQRDRGQVVARSRAVQQVGKAVGVLVAEVEGAVRGGIPGGDGLVGRRACPVELSVGEQGMVGI